MSSTSTNPSFLIANRDDNWGERYSHVKSEGWKEDPENPAKKIAVALVDGEVVSAVRTFDVELWLGTEFMTEAIGIGWVYTKPEHRGKKISTNLLRFAIHHLSPMLWGSAGIPCFVLYSRERNLYRNNEFGVIKEGDREHLWLRKRDFENYPMSFNYSDRWRTVPEHF